MQINQKARQKQLEFALILGDAYSNKVTLIFEGEGFEQEVEATVWATTPQNIVLKGGEMIPIQRIKGISLI